MIIVDSLGLHWGHAEDYDAVDFGIEVYMKFAPDLRIRDHMRELSGNDQDVCFDFNEGRIIVYSEETGSELFSWDMVPLAQILHEHQKG